jgi:hypothetical protein
MKIHLRAILLLVLMSFGLGAGVHAAGVKLDAKALQSLLSNRLWRLKPASSADAYFWSWKSDGSVCVRFEEKNAKCDDTGHWKLDGGRVCYELTWWGESLGFRSACFHVVDQSKGRYEAIEDNGVTAFEFTVVE